MSSSELRKEVLKTFKQLHRTSRFIFQNNKPALESAKKEINNGFKKNKHVSNIDSIQELIKFTNEIIYELKTTVVELEETTPGNFKIKLRPEMFEEHSNVPLRKLTK